MDGQRAAALFCRAKSDARAERPLQPVDERLAQRRIAVALSSSHGFWPRTPACRGFAGSPASHQILRLADTQSLLQHPLQGRHLLRRRGQSEESPGVSLADLTRAERTLHAVGKGEQTEGIGDAGAGAADALGDGRLRQPEIVDELAVGGRLLQRREVGAHDILDQRQLQHGARGRHP